MEKQSLTIEQKRITEEFVKELPKLRKKLGLSQTELGNMIGKSRQTISAIERNAVPLAWDTILAIILIFCTKDEHIFDNETYFNDIEKLIFKES